MSVSNPGVVSHLHLRQRKYENKIIKTIQEGNATK
jgi:hypothetical protein